MNAMARAGRAVGALESLQPLALLAARLYLAPRLSSSLSSPVPSRLATRARSFFAPRS